MSSIKTGSIIISRYRILCVDNELLLFVIFLLSILFCFPLFLSCMDELYLI